MKVTVVERHDANTIVCKVGWNAASREMVRIFVYVAATRDEYQMPAGAVEPPEATASIRQSAIRKARELATSFATLESTRG